MMSELRGFWGSTSSPKGGRKITKLRAMFLAGGALLWVATLTRAQTREAPPSSASSASPAQSLDARQLLQQLDSVSLDPTQVYSLRHAEITRDGLKFYFDRGFVGFLTPVAGEITGAVFFGDGEVLLMPPNAAERQSLAQFTQAPILEERFTSLYLRFTDQTARELKAHAERPDPEDPEQPGDFVLNWAPVVRSLAAQVSLRVLDDLLGARARPYFYARVGGASLGAFDAIDDQRAPEAISITAASQMQGKWYANVWCSFPGHTLAARASEQASAAVVRSYNIDTRINPDNSLEGHAQLEIESRSNVERLFSFELSRSLKVSEVRDGEGRSVTFFQNRSLEESEAAERGNDLVVVALSSPYPAGDRYRLDFTYRGNVISDAGNGVLFVGAHGSWYPNRGTDPQAQYDLTFHYPDHLSLVATGRLVKEDSSEGWKNSHWVSDGAFPVAGFNLGAYDTVTRQVGGVKIEVFVAPEAEASLEKRHDERQSREHVVTRDYGGIARLDLVPTVIAPLAPAALVDRVAQHAADTVRLYEMLFGPFPYPRLAISQIPGDFGQGWPELVYLPTLYFLPSTTRSELGFDSKSQEMQNRLLLAHEIAHQWWGNEVGWRTYHDQWLSEGFATYAAALDLAREKGGDRSFRALLASYRNALVVKNKDGKTVESGGPIWLGERLTTSLNPTGYSSIVYDKACWVLHMLRMMMRDSSPAGEAHGNPHRSPGHRSSIANSAVSSDQPAEESSATTQADEKFFRMLRDFVVAYRDQNPSTEDFAQFAAKYMNPAMDLDHNHRLDWFFDDWVRGTGIPTYKIESTVRPVANRFVVQGTVRSSNVPPEFEMLVPVIAQSGKAKTLLGEVPVTDGGARFRFVTISRPLRVTIDDSQILAEVK